MSNNENLPKTNPASNNETVRLQAEQDSIDRDYIDLAKFLEQNKNKTPEAFADGFVENSKKRVEFAKQTLQKMKSSQTSKIAGSNDWVKNAENNLRAEEDGLRKAQETRDKILAVKDKQKAKAIMELTLGLMEARLAGYNDAKKMNINSAAENNTSSTSNAVEKKTDTTNVTEDKNNKKTEAEPKTKIPTEDEMPKRMVPVFENGRLVYKAKTGSVEISELIDKQAHYDADVAMTESKEDRNANKFTKWLTRTWKHNLAEPYYRQKKYLESRKKILESQNLYVNEEGSTQKGNEEATDELIKRFTDDRKAEMLREGENSSKFVGNKDVNNLVKDFATGKITEAIFEQRKKALIAGLDSNYTNNEQLYRDNLLKVAQEIRDAANHGGKLADFDVDVELIIGRAKDRLHTEAHKDGFTKTWNLLKKYKIGSLFANEAGASLMGAAVYSAGQFFGGKALRSKAAKWLTFGGTGLLAGLLAGRKESKRLIKERAHHSLEVAKGKTFEADAERRKEMEKYKYKTRGAKEIISNLSIDLAKVNAGNLSEADLQTVLKNLADLESRMKLGNERKIDLVTYSHFEKVNAESYKLEDLRAQLKFALRKQNPKFDQDFSTLTTKQIKTLVDEEGGIEAKDKEFKHDRRMKALSRGAKVALFGSLLGFVTHEVISVFDHTHIPDAQLHDTPLGNSHLKLPPGVDIYPNTDGTYSFVQNNQPIEGLDHLKLLDSNGNVDTELLRQHGIGITTVPTGGIVTRTAAEYVKAHASEMPKIHYGTFYENGTPEFDGNELRTYFGGVNGTGFDADGNIVLDISKMLEDGSWHVNADGSITAVDAVAEMHAGKMEMVFAATRDTQHNPFPFKATTDGKIVIPKNSECFKQLWTKDANGHAKFLGKTGSVAHQIGADKYGNPILGIFGTLTGPKDGKELFQDDATILNIRIDMPNDMGVPHYMYAGNRRSLERGSNAVKQPVDSVKKPPQIEENKPKTPVEDKPAENNDSTNPTTKTEEPVPAKEKSNTEPANKNPDSEVFPTKFFADDVPHENIPNNRALQREVLDTSVSTEVLSNRSKHQSIETKRTKEDFFRDRILRAKELGLSSAEVQSLSEQADKLHFEINELERREKLIETIKEKEKFFADRIYRAKELGLSDQEVVGIKNKLSQFKKEIFEIENQQLPEYQKNLKGFISKTGGQNKNKIVNEKQVKNENSKKGNNIKSQIEANRKNLEKQEAERLAAEKRLTVPKIKDLIKQYPNDITSKTVKDLKVGDEVYFGGDKNQMVKVVEFRGNEVKFESLAYSGDWFVRSVKKNTVYSLEDLKKINDKRIAGIKPQSVRVAETSPVAPSIPVSVEESLIAHIAKDHDKGLVSFQDLREGNKIFVSGEKQNKIYTVKSKDKGTLVIVDPNNTSDKYTLTFKKGSYNIKKGSDVIQTGVQLDFYGLDESNAILEKES